MDSAPKESEIRLPGGIKIPSPATIDYKRLFQSNAAYAAFGVLAALAVLRVAPPPYVAAEAITPSTPIVDITPAIHSDQTTEAATEHVSPMEKFLFEGFSEDEIKTVAEDLKGYFHDSQKPREIGRNIAQNIQGTVSSELRPMQENLLLPKVATLVAELMPNLAPDQQNNWIKLAMAVFKIESNFRPGVINTEQDATGLGQVTPISAKEALIRFSKQAKKSSNPENSIYHKYFRGINVDLDRDKEIKPEEWQTIVTMLKKPDLNILISLELLKHYMELHTFPMTGLLAYGSNPNSLARAERLYANLVKKIPDNKLHLDFNGLDENKNPDPYKEQATILYTRELKMNPVNLAHPAVTGAMKSEENRGVKWDYPTIVLGELVTQNPEDFRKLASLTTQGTKA